MEDNGEKYIELFDEKYKVIGTIGYEFKTKMDDTILVNFMSAPVISLSSYSIDGKNINSIYKVLGEETIFGEVSIYDVDQVSITNINGTKTNYLILPILGIIVSGMYYFIFVKMWIKHYTSMIITLTELGETFKEVVRIVLLRLYSSFLIAIICTIILLFSMNITFATQLCILIIEFMITTLICIWYVLGIMRKGYRYSV